MLSSIRRTLAALLALTCPLPATAEEALVAVAANFAGTATELASRFEAESGHGLVITSGSTGKLYAQIVNGAPYDLFLAADKARPRKLRTDGLTGAGPVTYARGQLGIWIRDRTDPDEGGYTGSLTELRRIALANPALAPYGEAAMDVIDRLAIRHKLAGRLAFGENVGQAFAMVASGAADGGILSWSLILDAGTESQSWLVPADWHRPIEQDAVLLRSGEDNPAARAFFEYLTSEAGRAIIEQNGYLLP
jgi:molybdate transport system substrate-binding protein